MKGRKLIKFGGISMIAISAIALLATVFAFIAICGKETIFADNYYQLTTQKGLSLNTVYFIMITTIIVSVFYIITGIISLRNDNKPEKSRIVIALSLSIIILVVVLEQIVMNWFNIHSVSSIILSLGIVSASFSFVGGYINKTIDDENKNNIK